MCEMKEESKVTPLYKQLEEWSYILLHLENVLGGTSFRREKFEMPYRHTSVQVRKAGVQERGLGPRN